MKQRCNNPETPNYKDYGGRGIKVCSRWLESFENFYEDMGDCPKGMSIDRKDNDGDYCPENCRWATRKEQMNNTRKNRLLNFMGNSLTLSNVSEISGIFSPTIRARIDRLGWSEEKASLTKVRAYNMSKAKESKED